MITDAFDTASARIPYEEALSNLFPYETFPAGAA